MNRSAVTVLWVLVMVALILGVDVAFLRHRPWLRLLVNLLIVVVTGTIYLVLRRAIG